MDMAKTKGLGFIADAKATGQIISAIGTVRETVYKPILSCLSQKSPRLLAGLGCLIRVM